MCKFWVGCNNPRDKIYTVDFVNVIDFGLRSNRYIFFFANDSISI